MENPLKETISVHVSIKCLPYKILNFQVSGNSCYIQGKTRTDFQSQTCLAEMFVIKQN